MSNTSASDNGKPADAEFVPCVRCGNRVEGWFADPDEEAETGYTCERCYYCRICGTRKILSPEDKSRFPSCFTCYYTAHELSPQAKAMLIAMSECRPEFYMWDCKTKNISPPVMQPAEVSKDLFVGDYEDICDAEKLASRGVGAVLDLSQCGEWWIPQSLEEKGIIYKAIDCKDNNRYDIVAGIFPEAFDFIDSQIKLGRRVLVNCWAGENRSPTVVVGFLAQRQGMPLGDAFRLVMAKRGSIINNFFFRYLLARAQCPVKRRRLTRKTPQIDVPWYVSKRKWQWEW